MNIATQFTNFFTRPAPYKFTVYTNSYLSSDTLIQQQNETAFSFDSMIELEAKYESKIAYEPRENGQFSSDSIQNNPYTIMAVGAIQQNSNDNFNQIIDSLITYNNNTTILTVVQQKPMYRIYKNLKLALFNFRFTPNRTALYVNMTFQEIRMTTTQYGGLQQNNIRNPTNASVIDNGQQNYIIPPANNVASFGN